jgi:NADH:ubiquinone oxidoreductase subunit K
MSAEASATLNSLGLLPYLITGFLLFGIGLLGILTSRHLLRMLMCLELMLNAVNLCFVTLNHHLAPGTVSGQIMAVFILTVSAAEAAVGIAIVISLFRMRANVDVESYQLLKED